jgi:hypothetical protein
MKSVPVDKFQEQITFYLESIEPLAIENEGEILGFYYPQERRKEEKLKQTVAKLEKVLGEVLARNGMTEDEFADLFDMNKPFPYDEPNS